MKVPRKVESSQNQNPSNRGFSLIELLLVVAVILIIAAIAIPNFIQSKMRANEASAGENLRTISTAEVSYSTTYEIGYSTNLAKLSGTSATVDQNNAGLIDEVLASGLKSGYIYTYTVLLTDPLGNVTSYSVNADPQIPGTSGTLHFYTDQTAVIRSNSTAPAGPSDPPIS